MDFDSATVEW